MAIVYEPLVLENRNNNFFPASASYRFFKCSYLEPHRRQKSDANLFPPAIEASKIFYKPANYYSQ